MVIENRSVRRSRRPVRRLPVLALRAPGPLPTTRARLPSSPAPVGRRRSANAHPTEIVDLILELREKLTATGLDAGPDTIRWHLEHHHSVAVSRATISRYLTSHGLVVPEPKKKPKSSYIRFAAEMPNETWQSRLHPLPAHPPRRPTQRRHRDPDLARRLLPLRPLGHRPRPGHRPHRAGHLPPNRCRTRDSRLHADRQRDGVHHPALRGQGWPQRTLRDRTTTTQRGPEERATQPPHHPRQGRTVPADDEEVAARPARPAVHDRRPPGPPRRLRRGIQRAPAPPLATAPGDPGHRLHHPPQGAPRPATATTTPTTGSATTASTKPARSPCATTASSTPSASAEPTPEPASSSWPRTSTSASSTPPPASSSASSSSTHPSATKAPADHPARGAETKEGRTHVYWVRPSTMS